MSFGPRGGGEFGWCGFRPLVGAKVVLCLSFFQGLFATQMAETGVTLETTLSLPDADVTKEALDEDAVRLAKLGYKQEYARVFNT